MKKINLGYFDSLKVIPNLKKLKTSKFHVNIIQLKTYLYLIIKHFN